MKKRIIGVLILCLMLWNKPVAYANTETLAAEEIRDEESEIKFLEFTGKVTENVNDEISPYLVISKTEGDLTEYISVLYSERLFVIENMDFSKVDPKKIEVDTVVTVYYRNDIQKSSEEVLKISPEVLILNVSETPIYSVYGVFDDKLLSEDGMYHLRLSEESLIETTKGKRQTKENMKNQEVLAFFESTTMSLPAQISVKRAFIMPLKSEEMKAVELKYFQELSYMDEKWELKNSMKSEDGISWIPLREITEKLGYNVEWMPKTRSIVLKKDGVIISLKAGSRDYDLNGKKIFLRGEATVRSGVTYVPLQFLRELLGIDYGITGEGKLELK